MNIMFIWILGIWDRIFTVHDNSQTSIKKTVKSKLIQLVFDIAFYLSKFSRDGLEYTLVKGMLYPCHYGLSPCLTVGYLQACIITMTFFKNWLF